jgi:hypothetical protein
VDEASFGNVSPSSKQKSDFNVPEGSQGTLSGTVFLEHSKTGMSCRKSRPDSTGLDSSMTIVWPPDKALGRDWRSARAAQGPQSIAPKPNDAYEDAVPVWHDLLRSYISS